MIQRLLWLLGVLTRRDKAIHHLVEAVAKVCPAVATTLGRGTSSPAAVRRESVPAASFVSVATSPAPEPASPAVPAASSAPAPAVASNAPPAGATGQPAASPVPLRQLGAKESIDGSVWVLRILWALEYAARHHLGPQNAAEIARLLTTHAGLNVPSPNVARAFRERRQAQKDEPYWSEAEGQRYVISDAGRTVLREELAAA